MGEERAGQTQDEGNLVRQRREKLARLRERGQNPFRIARYERTHLAQDIHTAFDALEGETVHIAGRLMARRQHGKATLQICRTVPVPSSSYFA